MPARKKFDKLKLNPDYSGNEDTEKAVAAKDSKKLKSDKFPAEKPTGRSTYSFRPAEPKKKSGKIYTVGFIHVFIPFSAVFLLSLIDNLLLGAKAYNGLGNNAYLILRCVISAIIFIVPIIVYCKIRKKNVIRGLSIHRFSLSYMPFIILGLFLLASAIASERLAINYLFPEATAQAEISLSGQENKVAAVLSYAVFPAICQELFLRGLLQNEISEKAGGITGIVISSLAFALIHFDLRYFAVYLTAGLILSVCAHVTNSVFPGIIIHILSNIFSLAFSARLTFIASERTGSVLIIALLVFFALLVLVFYLRSLENLCIKKAYLEDIKNGTVSEENKDSDTDTDKNPMYHRTPFRLSSSTGFTFHKFIRVLFSPAIIVSVILFFFASV